MHVKFCLQIVSHFSLNVLIPYGIGYFCIGMSTLIVQMGMDGTYVWFPNAHKLLTLAGNVFYSTVKSLIKDALY